MSVRKTQITRRFQREKGLRDKALENLLELGYVECAEKRYRLTADGVEKFNISPPQSAGCST